MKDEEEMDRLTSALNTLLWTSINQSITVPY